MAIDLTVEYPGKVDPATVPFPYGVPRNINTPGDGTGTPWEAAIVKDGEGFKQALLKSAGIVPSGTPDQVGASEYLQSVVELASGRADIQNVTGTVDDIVLTKKADQEAAQSLYVGLSCTFITSGTNTTVVTINYNGLGVKSAKKGPSGTPFAAGDLVSGRMYEAVYNGIDFLIKGASSQTDLIDIIYPVGSIYISTVATNPGTLFGVGTWIASGVGSVLVGVGTSDATYALDDTGGESEVTLDETMIPAHTHGYQNRDDSSGQASQGSSNTSPNNLGNKITDPTGGGLPHENMPPYLTVHMWERTL